MLGSTEIKRLKTHSTFRGSIYACQSQAAAGRVFFKRRQFFIVNRDSRLHLVHKSYSNYHPTEQLQLRE